MIRQAQAVNAHHNVSYAVDVMPHLHTVREKIRMTGQKYDLVVLSAAWMHLDAPSRATMFRTLFDIANPGAVMFITLRHGPAPADRPMYAVSADELRGMAADFLVHLEHLTDGKADKLGRGDVWWDSVALKMPNHHVDALPVYRDAIIHAPKNTSYKLGFAQCFLDTIRNNADLIREADDARYAIPLGPMLPQWMRMYNGLAEAGLVQVRRPLADSLNATRRFADVAGGVSIHDFNADRVFEGAQAQSALRMMNAAHAAIVQNGPVRFISRPGSAHPLFAYVPSAQVMDDRVVVLNHDHLAGRFGHILVAKDIVHAGRDYAPLIEAGVMREWARFSGRIAGIDDPAQVQTRLENVMKIA
jgi:hypothetical protein